MKIALIIAICLLATSCAHSKTSHPLSAKHYMRAYYDSQLWTNVVWSSVREIKRKNYEYGSSVIYVTTKFKHLAYQETIEIILRNGHLVDVVQITKNNKNHLWNEHAVLAHP